MVFKLKVSICTTAGQGTSRSVVLNIEPLAYPLFLDPFIKWHSPKNGEKEEAIRGMQLGKKEDDRKGVALYLVSEALNEI